jgi:hypothetical protein
MYARRIVAPRRGIALITVLLVSLVVASLMVVAAMLGSNTSLISRYHQRSSVLGWAADAGIEEARAAVNADKTLYPDSGFATLENDAPVRDASGAIIPNVTRSVYVGPVGDRSGQYGVAGAAVSVVTDAFGNTVVRRGAIDQESFAKFAYFTDVEPSDIKFGNGDQIQGPVHSNDDIQIYESGATFFGPVTTAKRVLPEKKSTAIFKQGYTEHGPEIPFPETADLSKLSGRASAGNMLITGSSSGSAGQATTRIEFVALDLNADGDSTDANEGFIRVYQSDADPGWVVADVPDDYYDSGGWVFSHGHWTHMGPPGLSHSENCGHYESDGTFRSANDHGDSGGDDWVASVSNSRRRCYLGGADSLWGGFQATDAHGAWLPWPGTVSPIVSAARSAEGDAAYLWPISRDLNPSFKGVIFVDGKVAISGTLRGKVTLAATGNIIIADDIVYATNPGAGVCNDGTDMLGLFSGNDILVADNTINAPVNPTNNGGNDYKSYDDTEDEFVDAVVLAIGVFTVENYDSGAERAEPCGSRQWGRGCLFLTGGIIQSTRGAVGTTAGTGYVKRYSYDACAAASPPPYFPTTGHFVRGRYFEVDPTGFDVTSYFAKLTPHE